jgi:hypothetical protein
MRTPRARSKTLLSILVACAGLAALPARASAEVYEVRATEAKAVVGAKTTATVHFATRQGWHLNKEAPFTLKLTPDAGLAVDKPKLTRADLARSTDEEAQFDVVLTAAEAGDKVVQAEAGFVICRETECRPIKEKLVIKVAAAVPAPKPAEKAKGKRSKKG